MHPAAEPTTTDTPAPPVEVALQLLRHAGHQLPAVEEIGREAWLQLLIKGLCELSSRDPLTGLSNRRQFELALAREVDRVARSGETAMVLIIDIDHFKRVNDTHGHAAGDLVIKSVALVLQDCIRPMDTVARLGGEEFAMVLPNCQPGFGMTIAERVRMQVQASRVPVAPGREVAVTVSIGGAFAPQWVRSSAPLWLERADQQLYNAKSSGRNRACVEEPLVSPVSAEEKGLLFGTSYFQELE